MILSISPRALVKCPKATALDPVPPVDVGTGFDTGLDIGTATGVGAVAGQEVATVNVLLTAYAFHGGLLSESCANTARYDPVGRFTFARKRTRPLAADVVHVFVPHVHAQELKLVNRLVFSDTGRIPIQSSTCGLMF
jgi:hypothetical protein